MPTRPLRRRAGLRRGLLLFALLFAGLVAVLPPGRATGAGKVLADPGAVYPGLYNIGDPAGVYDEFTAQSGGVAPPIVFTFHDWNRAGVEAATPVLQTFHDPLEGEDSPSPLELAARVAEDGGVVALAWDAVGYFFEHPDYFDGGGTMAIRWDEVFAGRYDDYVRTVAREVKGFGGPILLSPAGEFNSIGFFSFGAAGNEPLYQLDEADLGRHYGDPAVPDGPERVRDLFRRVVDIFREEEVENVTWFLYSHSAYMNPDDLEQIERERLDAVHPRHYYPGDDYVDWIGNSVYVDADDPERDVAFAVDASLEAFRSFTDKPFFAPELGVVSASGADRSERMRRLFEEELPAYEDLRAFAFADGELWARFFDIPRLGNHPGEIDAWRESVWGSGLYTGELLIGVPEPASAALVALLVVGSVRASRRR